MENFPNEAITRTNHGQFHIVGQYQHYFSAFAPWSSSNATLRAGYFFAMYFIILSVVLGTECAPFMTTMPEESSATM